MVRIAPVLGDITTQTVDAIVNAASGAMRGGGGVDGAIHRAGGRAILEDCIARFPRGLATGDAGWTTAGDLPARWVIHSVGPNFRAGERDRALLESCYRRALEVADGLGARSVAFPLISAGVYGWPQHEAIATAVETLSAAESSVDRVVLVAHTPDVFEEINAALSSATPVRILQGVRALHERGFHRVRAFPGMSPSGTHWRVAITTADNMVGEGLGETVRDWDRALVYSSAGGIKFAGGEVAVGTRAGEVADLIVNAIPVGVVAADDPDYVEWFARLLQRVEREDALPVAYSDNGFVREGWEIGWGSGVHHPHPPAPRDSDGLVRALPTVLSGDERLLDGQVRDFWRWALNDLRMNTARGYLAEYLVARAVGDPAPFRIEWDTHDVTAPDGTRIEVKACGRLQSWKSRGLTPVRWTIPKPNPRAWSDDTAGWVASDPAQRVDVWVFALQTATDPEAYDPLDADQWEFRVLPHHAIYGAGQRSFAVSALDQLGARVVDYGGLAAAVREASSSQATRRSSTDDPDGS